MSACAVRVAAAAVLITWPTMTAAQSPPTDRPTVAVVGFNNSSLINHAEYAPLSKGMADLIGSALRSNPAVKVVERDALQDVLREQNLATEGRIDDATAAKVGRLLGALYLIKGTFFIEPRGRVRITASAVNTTTGEVEHSANANGSTEDLLAVIDELGANFSKGLKLGTFTPPQRGRESSGQNRWAALIGYSRALEADDKGNAQSAISLYSEFLKAPGIATYVGDQRRYAERRLRALGGGS